MTSSQDGRPVTEKTENVSKSLNRKNSRKVCFRSIFVILAFCTPFGSVT